jgi:hypothetical protein
MMLSSILQFVRLDIDCMLCFISVVGVLVCLLPLFMLDILYTPSEAEIILSDNLEANQSISASLFIVIIPLVDVLLDYCQQVWDWFEEKKPQKKQRNDTTIYRLTEGERFIFIIGMIVQSAVCFLPLSISDFDLITITVIYHCTRTAAQLFFVVPILFYLKRCTTIFNTLIASSIILSVTIGLMLFSLKILYHSDPTLHDQMQQSAVVFKGFAVVLFLATVFISYCLFLIETYSIVTNRKVCINFGSLTSIYNFLIRSKFDESQNDKYVGYMYTHIIPALHMFSYVIISVGGLLRMTDTISFENFSNISLGGQTIVLIIELRIRKNEIARGLVNFLMFLVYFISVFSWIHIISY